MRESTVQQRTDPDGADAGSLGDAGPRTSLIAILGAVLVTPLGFVVVRQAWQAIHRHDLLAPTSVTIVTTTPWSVLLTQAGIAVALVVLLGVEWITYARRGRVMRGWWVGGPLAGGTRSLGLVVGVALFPAGAFLGVRSVVPWLLTTFVPPGQVVTAVEYGAFVGGVSLLAGVAAQVTFVALVVGFSRYRSSMATAPDAR